MERETKSFTTTGGNEIVAKTYLTGRETREINRAFFKKADDFSATDIAEKGVAGSQYEQCQNEGFKQVIVSINGHKEGDTVDGQVFHVLDFILDLKNSEYKEIVKAVNEITNDARNSEEKKTA